MQQSNKQVFETVCDLIKNSNFLSEQRDFCEKYTSLFDLEDENKLEYTGIFETYVKILESNIEAQLLDKYSREQVDSFYEHLKGNHADYKASNEESFQVLLGFIDFAVFKKYMLDLKRGDVDGPKTSKQNPEEAREMLDGFLAEDHENGANGWEKMIDIDGDKISGVVYQKKVAGYSVPFDLSVLKFKNTSLEAMRVAVGDIERILKSNKAVKEQKVFEMKTEGNKTTCIYSSTMTFGQHMADRQGTFQFISELIDDTLSITLQNVDHPEAIRHEGNFEILGQKKSIIKKVGEDLTLVDVKMMDMGLPATGDKMQMGSMLKKGTEAFAKQIEYIEAELAAKK